MKTQTLKMNFKNSTTGKSWSKSLTDIPNNTVTDVEDAVTQSKSYNRIVDGTVTGGEIHTVEPFDVTNG